MIILNEVEYAESILEKKELGKKPFSTLFLLSKYFRDCKNYSRYRIFAELINFIMDSDPEFHPPLLDTKIENMIKSSEKYKIRNIEGIGITQKEIDAIKGADKEYQRMLFTLLCYAKYHYIVSDGKNSWVREPLKELFDTAGIKMPYVRDRYHLIFKLGAFKWLSFAKKNTNLSLKIEYMDTENEPVFYINDFRELGNEWENYIGVNKFIRCERCNRLVLKKSNVMKYCKTCKSEINREKTRVRMQELRNPVNV